MTIKIRYGKEILEHKISKSNFGLSTSPGAITLNMLGINISIIKINGIKAKNDMQSIFFANWCLLYIASLPSIALRVGMNAEWKVSPERDCWNEKGSLSAITKIFDNTPDPRKAAINISLMKPEICENNMKVELIKEFFVKSIFNL